jgi:hypothetical protein
VAGSEDGMLSVYDTRSGTPLHRLNDPSTPDRCLAFACYLGPTGPLVATGKAHRVTPSTTKRSTV